MILNQIIYTDNTIMTGLIVCCLIVLAVVMIPKAVRHRRQVKQNEKEKTVQSEYELQMIVLPTDENKQLSYKEIFIRRNKIKKRDCVYISHETHSKIMKLTKAMGNITIGGYVDTVLKEHLKQYKKEINSIYQESRKDLL